MKSADGQATLLPSNANLRDYTGETLYMSEEVRKTTLTYFLL